MSDGFIGRKMRFDVLRLKRDGLSCTEIAAQLGCKVSSVSLALERLASRDFRVARLPADQFFWLENEAHKAGVRPAELARSLLVDAVHEAMECEL